MTFITNAAQPDADTLERTLGSLVAADYEVIKQDANDKKIKIYLPASDLSIRLYPRQLYILQLYDGTRTTDDILEHASRGGMAHMKLSELKAFEAKVLRLGFLTNPSGSSGLKPDPFSGIEYGITQRKLPKVFFNLNEPSLVLGPVMAFLRRPFGLGVLICLALIALYGLYLSFLNFDQTWKQLPYLLNEVWWVFLFYPVWFTVMTLHEFGHAAACHAIGVPMREIGIGRRGLLLVGWAKPDQKMWGSLSYSKKFFTVIIGPIINVACFGVGIVLSTLFSDKTFQSIILSASFLPLFTVISTLLPTNKGDAYLLLSEAIGQPGYYTRSMYHVWNLFKKRSKPKEKNGVTIWLLTFGFSILLTRMAMLSIVTIGVLQALWLLSKKIGL